ncbi:hypothetical protein VaNZ11_001166 [Volvox africanus]|uniref:AB hydrolase-1 domain-containing protein n=1 Tax=Volvox africanus TaxID=51714 RepID=A0ABQ5RP35_9CHLO|nr:hypothetical protein VaNZ11_001166 [Volvox africanus]
MAFGAGEGFAYPEATADLPQPKSADPMPLPGEQLTRCDTPPTFPEPSRPPETRTPNRILSSAPSAPIDAETQNLPRPHQPCTSAPPHIKTHHHCTTSDGWRLHLVRTREAQTSTVTEASTPSEICGDASSPASSASAGCDVTASTNSVPPRQRRYPVILCPGLGSSGAYTFDLSPVVSLADYLASKGWDVWTVELRGNGQSDRPRLFVRSRWWTIDDYVTKDLPAVLQYVRHATGAPRAHVLGHSMGGMILTRLLALGGPPGEAVASATVVGSGCFLRGSWWQALQHTLWLARFLWLVPAGATLRAYSPLALGRAGLQLVDELYFWPPNTDPLLARALLARNFSAISAGVILQFGSGFGIRGLCTADGKEAYADAARLARVETPVLFVCGDRDRMCPPQGAEATCALFTGSRCARFTKLGPKYGTRDHYGHFDILMGHRVEQEVFPLLAAWLDEHDGADLDPAETAASSEGATGNTVAAASVATPGRFTAPQPAPMLRSKL